MTKNEMAKMIDHTLLKSEAAEEAVKKLTTLLLSV